ncbi:hypothetical protein DAPPUDRAFT_96692 [Daphnia pulex]|uniref:Sodium/nucleoside cotransporter n=1 Tax=Daphnia pulex TaxID=6669 RepID=E9FYM2_DAPPU|nr:hypothetical protein DAPPUDRAFT_96692 [Daphnia pulex]|eukprot:EFX87744.1 hypothetical protein DAPPUDRAFT_96692 [Daphnia pulex]
MDLESPQNESKSAGDFVEGFWSYVGNFAEKNRFKITVFLRIFAAISYNCYFVAVVYNAHLKQLDIDWCGGVGMLIILTVIVYCGLFYYKVFKPHWGDSAYSRVILPLTLILERCWSYRFLRLLVIAGGVAGFIVGLVLDTAGDRDRLYSLIGLAVFLLFGWIFSKHPSQIKWTQVIWGMILQFLFGLMVLRWKTGQQVFACLGDRVSIFLKYTDAGSGLVYGHLVTDQNASGIPLGTIFAFKALSVIFLFSFMVNILYYYGVMQMIVQKVGWFLQVKEANALDAAAQGASNAVFMVINICANLIAFLAFIAFLNGIISWMGGLLGAPYVTFEYLVGKCFIPLAWIMGIPAEECDQIGHVVALKTIVNEFVAYRQLSEYMAKGLVSKRSETIATFALCGFSNPGSIGIQIAALGSMAPSRQTDLAQVAFRAFVSGSIACFMTACVAEQEAKDLIR